MNNVPEIEYFRISVTDRCNYRCAYCMPEQGIIPRPHSEILTYDEVTTIVGLALELGVKKVRLSGGEPLVRRNIVNLVNQIGNLHGLKDFAMTTNGSLLTKHAMSLKQSGLHRINISLDTLDHDRFSMITGGGMLSDVLSGVAAARQAGISPIKINTVLMHGFNDDEVFDLLRWSCHNGFIHRFIELMPVGSLPFWTRGKIIPEKTTRALLEPRGDLIPCEPGAYAGPARYYRWTHTGQIIGFISPMTSHFCNACNRLRMTADGRIMLCLFSEEGANIRDALRMGGRDDALSLLKSVFASKHKQTRPNDTKTFAGCNTMSQLGG